MNEFIFLATNSNNRDIKVQIIKSFYALILTLTNKRSLYYIFSNNFINQIISNDFFKYDEDFLSYYVNFLKSLTLKIDNTTIQFFFQKTQNRFPLLENAFKLYNHTDPMIKNVVRNIFLTFGKMKYEPIYSYFCSLPCITYFTFIACRLRDLSLILNNLSKGNILANYNTMMEEDKIKMNLFLSNVKDFDFHRLKSLHDDLIDEVLYLQDIFSLEHSKINLILENCLLYYFILPLLFRSLIQQDKKVNNQTTISPTLAIYLLCLLIKCIKNDSFLNILISLIFQKTINVNIIEKYINIIPCSPDNYYFDWKEQKKFTELPFYKYITYNFSPQFITSLISLSSSHYKEVQELVKEYAKLFTNNGNFNPSDNYQMIVRDVLKKMADKMESLLQYHKQISIATGVSCGLLNEGEKDSVILYLDRTKAQKENLEKNPIREYIINGILHNIDELGITIVNVLIDTILHKNEISKELLSQCDILPCEKWHKEGKNVEDLNIKKDLDESKDKTKIINGKEKKIFPPVKIPRNYFDNIYYSKYFSIIQTNYDSNLVDSLINLLLIEKPFASLETLLIINNLSILLTSPLFKSPIASSEKEYIRKNYYTYLTKIKLSLLTNMVLAETGYEHFENQWSVYNTNLHSKVDKLLITSFFFLNPILGENVVDYPFKKMKNETDIFKHNLISFMGLYDLIQKINNNNDSELIYEKFPLKNGNFVYPIGSEIPLNTMESTIFKCKAKRYSDKEYDERYLFINLNFVYFGSIKEEIIIIKNKYPLRKVEIFNERDNKNLLNFSVCENGKYIDMYLLFEYEEIKNKAKLFLEEERKKIRIWEKEQIGKFFENLISKCDIKCENSK